ncbi:SseB family protein [Georgenia sp. Z1491]|uniref:SseB family protein n=1 Tax=Georgenia sp. Z1491 TaxID=3416707 RepID=UPI003CF4CCFD
MKIPVTSSIVLPPIVYVPVSPGAHSGSPHHDLLEQEDGRTGLPVYTALDRLQSARGVEHGWALMSLAGLETAISEGLAHVVVIDHDASHPAPSAEELAATAQLGTTGQADTRSASDRPLTRATPPTTLRAMPGWSTSR